eukprot:1152833-Pelagomonas_calceolata.AAC.1
MVTLAWCVRLGAQKGNLWATWSASWELAIHIAVVTPCFHDSQHPMQFFTSSSLTLTSSPSIQIHPT